MCVTKYNLITCMLHTLRYMYARCITLHVRDIFPVTLTGCTWIWVRYMYVTFIPLHVRAMYSVTCTWHVLRYLYVTCIPLPVRDGRSLQEHRHSVVTRGRQNDASVSNVFVCSTVQTIVVLIDAGKHHDTWKLNTIHTLVCNYCHMNDHCTIPLSLFRFA